MDRSNLDRIRSNIGVGQGAVRNADTRSKDMTTFNYQALGTKPSELEPGGVLGQTGGYGTVGTKPLQVPNTSGGYGTVGTKPLQVPNTSGGYVRPQFQNGMSAPAFANSYNTFTQNSAGIPRGMSYGDWMRSGQFFKPADPFKRPPLVNPAIRPNPYQTDPFQSGGGGTDIKPGPGKPSQQMNPPGNSGVTRPPRYVQPMFSVGGP